MPHTFLTCEPFRHFLPTTDYQLATCQHCVAGRAFVALLSILIRTHMFNAAALPTFTPRGLFMFVVVAGTRGFTRTSAVAACVRAETTVRSCVAFNARRTLCAYLDLHAFPVVALYPYDAVTGRPDAILAYSGTPHLDILLC